MDAVYRMARPAMTTPTTAATARPPVAQLGPAALVVLAAEALSPALPMLSVVLPLVDFAVDVVGTKADQGRTVTLALTGVDDEAEGESAQADSVSNGRARAQGRAAPVSRAAVVLERRGRRTHRSRSSTCSGRTPR